MKNLSLMLVLTFTLLPGIVTARMYQWVDPETGTTQLSGTPPHWYRNGEPGPRVYVFDGGRVIDNTAIAVSETEQTRLRHEAVLQVERDQAAAREKLLEAERLKAAMAARAAEQEAAQKEIPAEPQVETAPAEGEEGQDAGAPEGPTADQMRALIDEWEKVRTEEAKSQLQSGAVEPAGDDSE